VNDDEKTLANHLNSKIFNLALFDCLEFGEAEFETIQQLKRAHSTFPVLIVASNIDKHFGEQLSFLADVHMLLKPITEKSLIGLIRKLLVAHRVPKQVYQRFNTNQIAQMEALSNGDNILSSMYNLSKGGAYCEYEGQDPISVGDLLRLKVVLDETQKEYTFNAKVVWTTTKGRFTGRFGCGFKFVSAKDTYRSMLSRA
jgi:Tfp pilus assembly protein PilZ